MSSTAENQPTGSRLWSVGDGGRSRLKMRPGPDAIRTLTTALDAGIVPDTYVTNGELVVLEQISGAANPAAGDDDVALPLTASVLRPPRLAGLLAEHADIVKPKIDEKGNMSYAEYTPPATVLAPVLARKSWARPVLHRIISTPVLRPDGTLLQTPGYDPATGFYLAANSHLAPIPEQPTPDQVAAAREFLLDRFLADFPWRDHQADRANYLALLATPLIRPFTRALSPFGMIEASMPSSGKTILTGCVGLLVGQRVLTWTDSEEELRKSITTVLADEAGVVVFDNLVEGEVVNSAVLARLMTERTWTDRKLGSNSALTFANDRLWLATGNNLHTGGDMASRTVWVRLDPNCPRPEARTGFTIPNLDTWILDPANRAEVLRHVLILVLDWTANGAPTSRSVPPMRQFTRWAQYLGGLLEHHDITGFLANADAGRDLDDDAGEWRGFLLRWHELFGDKQLSAHQLRLLANPESGDQWNGTFPTTGSGQVVSNKSLGKLLSGQVDRWRGDIVLRREKDSDTNASIYRVERKTDDDKTP
ncbi:hypothetical protein [Amycolatopsis magusensis]|uniref:hypothetical protein n=1 Tax=Amycolatopsis magusensis TaxID=882444 RepID=UPI0024A8CD87|nr:hypothetical protein [Amycolatopsis magusensis]MDI5974779.1 hypothetical protein [Amycolatopsis magusensis]